MLQEIIYLCTIPWACKWLTAEANCVIYCLTSFSGRQPCVQTKDSRFSKTKRVGDLIAVSYYQQRGPRTLTLGRVDLCSYIRNFPISFHNTRTVKMTLYYSYLNYGQLVKNPCWFPLRILNYDSKVFTITIKLCMIRCSWKLSQIGEIHSFMHHILPVGGRILTEFQVQGYFHMTLIHNRFDSKYTFSVTMSINSPPLQNSVTR